MSGNYIYIVYMCVYVLSSPYEFRRNVSIAI